MKLNHYILTRLNESFPDNPLEHDRAADLGLDETWLSQRLDLLEKYTAQSLARQTCMDFTWVVKCHERTPDWARNRISRHACIALYGVEKETFDSIRANRYFEAIYENQIPSNRLLCAYAFRAWILRDCATGVILTTRLDSDDGLARDYVETVQARFILNSHVDFSKGVVAQGNQYRLLDRTTAKQGPSQFLTYAELYSEDLRTTYFKDHHYCRPALVIPKIGWLQAHHQDNLANNLINSANFAAIDLQQVYERFPFLQPFA